MVRYILFVLALLALGGVHILLGGGVYLLDAPSLVVIVLPACLLVCGYHGPRRLFASLRSGLSAQHDEPDRGVAESHRAVLQTLRSVFLAGGAIGMLIGMVQMLARLDDPAVVAPAAAVALLCPLYAFLFAEILIAPLVKEHPLPPAESVESDHVGGYRQPSGGHTEQSESLGRGAIAVRVAWVVCGLTVFVLAMRNNGSVGHFIDLASIFMVIGLGASVLPALIGPRTVWDALKASLAPRSRDADEIATAVDALERLRAGVLRLAGLAVASAIVGLLQALDDPAKIGPFMALALLSVLYALVVAELLISPLAARLSRHLAARLGRPVLFIESLSRRVWLFGFVVFGCSMGMLVTLFAVFRNAS